MKLKIFCLLFFIVYIARVQISQAPVGFIPNPPTNPNPDFSPYWYKRDCCPRIQLAQSIQQLNNNQHLIQTYNHFRYNKCPCTHIIFAIDKSGSMWNIWNQTEDTLNFWAQIIGYFPCFFMTYYFFDHIAYIPQYLHVHPFSPVPFPYSPSGGTNFNAAIYRAIQIVSLYLTENTCFLIISDGGGSFSYPLPILDFVQLLDKVRENGCWTCRVCFYIKPTSGSITGQFEVFQDLCDKLEAKFVQATKTTYRRVFRRTFEQLAQNQDIKEQKDPRKRN